MATLDRKPGKPNMLADPVSSTLFRTAVPTTIGAVAVILYYLADTYFVSLLGTRELAALGFTFPATILVTYFGVGLGIGTSALVARAIGSNNMVQASEMTYSSILLGLVLGILFILPGLWSINLLFPAMGAGPDLMPLIRDFLSIWYFGIPMLLIQFAGSSVLRAGGNAKFHGIFMATGAALNALLDPLLIFGAGPFPAMGIAGAAMATVVTWVITNIGMCIYLARLEGLLTFRWPGLVHIKKTWHKLLRITLPAALANMITPIATGIITATLAAYGTHAVAAFGVVSRIEAFVMIVVLGMSMSLPPFISQNFGANRFDRVQQALSISLKFVQLWQFGLYLVVALTAPWIAAIFTNDPAVREVITIILWILPASYGFQGLVILTASCFNALHAPRNALITSLLRFVVFYVPLALLGAWLGDIPGLFLGAALGNLLAGAVSSRWINRYVIQLQPTEYSGE
ncbi:MAG: MATE family efflux transporter [Pseudohongiellaceae bacterium]